MNWNKKDHIKKAFDRLLPPQSREDEIEQEKNLLIAKFLHEIEIVMEERNITRKELAKLIHTSPSYLTQVFRGHKPLNLETLAKISKALDLQFDVKVNKNYLVQDKMRSVAEDG